MACSKHRRKAYSITSSARASTVGGKVRPSDLAVLRLTTNSYRCLHRQVGWLLTLEDAIDITSRAPVWVDRIGSVGDQAAANDEEAFRTLRPSVQPSSCNAWANATRRACPAGSSAAKAMRTPIRRILAALLRLRRRRPSGCYTAEQRDELAASQVIELHLGRCQPTPDHSISNWQRSVSRHV
jgi:hypothetical protein